MAPLVVDTIVLQTSGRASPQPAKAPKYRAEDEGFYLSPGEERVVRLLVIGTSVGSPEGQVFSGGGSIGARYGKVL